MTAKEIKAKIEKLEERSFLLNMKDRWEARDYEYDRQLDKEIRELKEELKKLEN